VKNGHTNGHAVANLFKNDGARSIGYFAINFNTAIDRTGVHDHCIGLKPRRAFGI
jgi:hypothetical protein